MTKPVIYILLLTLVISCNNSNNDEHSKASYNILKIDEPYNDLSKELIGNWINKSTNDTILFNSNKEIKINNNLLLYSFEYSDVYGKDTLLVFELKCDTFFNAVSEIDSVSCESEEIYHYKILSIDQDEVVLNSFINSNKKTVLKKVK